MSGKSLTAIPSGKAHLGTPPTVAGEKQLTKNQASEKTRKEVRDSKEPEKSQSLQRKHDISLRKKKIKNVQ